MKRIYLLLCLALIGCATTRTFGTKVLSQEFIEKNIIKGKTTKEEVRQLLGKPSSAITMANEMPKINMPMLQNDGSVKPQEYDMSGMMPAEIWTYTKVEMHQVGLNPMGFLNYAITGSLYDKQKTTSISINFNKEGIVTGYSFMEL